MDGIEIWLFLEQRVEDGFDLERVSSPYNLKWGKQIIILGALKLKHF